MGTVWCSHRWTVTSGVGSGPSCADAQDGPDGPAAGTTNDGHMDEPRFPTGEELLADAKRSFPQYYLLGEEEEICALNALVLAQVAFVMAVNAVRPKSDREA